MFNCGKRHTTVVEPLKIRSTKVIQENNGNMFAIISKNVIIALLRHGLFGQTNNIK